MHPIVLLLLAIVSEVIATSALKASEGFTRPGPVMVLVIGYGLAFYLMSLVIRTLPVGMVYAIWSGLGTAGIVLVGALVFRQVPNGADLSGIALIIVGVLVLNLFGTVSH